MEVKGISVIKVVFVNILSVSGKRVEIVNGLNKMEELAQLSK